MLRIRSARTLVTALLVFGALAAAPAGYADGDGQNGGAQNGGQEQGKDGAKDAPKDAAKDGDAAQTERTTRLERARRLVRELETALTILKAAKTADAETLRALERALEEARKLAKPITAAELTEEERARLAEEFAKPEEPKTEDPNNPWAGFRDRMLDAAFKDVELSEDERIKATQVIDDWWAASDKARRAADSKGVSDAKRLRDDTLTKALGRKKGMKVVNNLNSMSAWKR